MQNALSHLWNLYGMRKKKHPLLNFLYKLQMGVTLSILGLLFLAKISPLKRKIKVFKDIPYRDLSKKDFQDKSHLLDLFIPDEEGPFDVFIFIHGGSWNHGDKNLYGLIGRNMAKHGKLAVVINYRLSPEFHYEHMVEDCADALEWTRNNIGRFKGNPTRIFISGHSAGGHLAASITESDHCGWGKPESLKGSILIDAFGLNIHQYLSTYKTPSDRLFYHTFTENPETWKKASPLNFVRDHQVPCLILAGSNTYPPILEDSREFHKVLTSKGRKSVYLEINGKKHAAMVVQLFWKRNNLYEIIMNFMDSCKEITAGTKVRRKRIPLKREPLTE